MIGFLRLVASSSSPCESPTPSVLAKASKRKCQRGGKPSMGQLSIVERDGIASFPAKVGDPPKRRTIDRTIPGENKISDISPCISVNRSYVNPSNGYLKRRDKGLEIQQDVFVNQRALKTRAPARKGRKQRTPQDERVARSFGARLKEFREIHCRQSQPDMADYLGEKESTYKKYEQGVHFPPPGFLEKLGELGADMNWLILGYTKSGAGSRLPRKASISTQYS